MILGCNTQSVLWIRLKDVYTIANFSKKCKIQKVIVFLISNKNNMEENNLCFIDGQNLHIGIKLEKDSWSINLNKFRKYLFKKYQVKLAYYYLGYDNRLNNKLYKKLRDYNFSLVFKDHIFSMYSKKKGNVDSDIIFDIMKKICEKENFNKVILISGDGDYFKLVDYLIEKDKFKKILFPNKKYASSLYKKLTGKYFDYLINVKHIIGK